MKTCPSVHLNISKLIFFKNLNSSNSLKLTIYYYKSLKNTFKNNLKGKFLTSPIKCITCGP